MEVKSLIEEILENKNYHYDIPRIAKETGISEYTIRRILSGKTKEPRYKNTLRLLSLYLSIKLQKNIKSSN